MNTENINTKLSAQGYSLKKSELNNVILEQIKKDLTVKPKTFNAGYADTKDDEFEVFSENDSKIYLPKFYGITKYGLPKVNTIANPDANNLKFSVNMRPQQKPIIEAYMNNISLDNGGGGIICAGCGVGKTVISLYISTLLKVKTLVIVHKEFLMNQWIERIKEFIPDARIGIIQGDKYKVEDKHIVIGMLQSVSKRKYPSETFSKFGFVIYDECHHLGAKVFSKALKKTNFKFTLGLSATPERNDGLTKVFLWNLGNIVYQETKKKTDNVLVHYYSYYNDDQEYSKEVRNFKKQLMNPVIINNIANCKNRNNFIISLLTPLIQEGRNVLILTERIAQVNYFYQTVQELNIASIGKYIGRMKQEDLDLSLECRILVGTYNMIEEGFDCKTLDTLIMATPKVNIEQSVGRILRKQASERTIIPLIIDICDQFCNFGRKGKQRITYYNKHKYTVNKFEVDNNVNNVNNSNSNYKFKVTNSLSEKEKKLRDIETSAPMLKYDF